MPTSGYGRDSHNARRQSIGQRPTVMPPATEYEVWDLTAGVRGDKTPKEIPPNATPFCENVRFDGTSLRPEFGSTGVGDPGSYRVLGLADHKYILDNTTFHRIMRIVRDDLGMARVESWTGSEWVVAATSSLPLENVMLSVVSTQNYLLFADGKVIYKWEEPAAGLILIEDDFDAGNLVYRAASGDSPYPEVTLITSQNYDQPMWRVHFDVRLKFKHSGDPKAPPISYHSMWTNITVWSAGVLRRTVYIPHTFFYDLNDSWQYYDTTWAIGIEGLGYSEKGTTQIKVAIDSYGIDDSNYIYDWGVELHGHNKAVDGDDPAGVRYNVYDDPGGTISKLSEYAPGASHIFPFGDRLIALQDSRTARPDPLAPIYGPQTFACSADADLDTWVDDPSNPDDADVVYAGLLDSVGDSIDDLQACGFVAGNRAALIRKRTIMQILETGNVQFPIAAQHWVEGIGTESPHSVTQARDGICFLGHNLMVYYFDGTGPPVAIGVPIHEILRRTLTSNQHLVDSCYDPIYDELYLGIPENGANYITRIWIGSLGSALDEREMKWRSRAQIVERLATVSTV